MFFVRHSRDASADWVPFAKGKLAAQPEQMKRLRNDNTILRERLQASDDSHAAGFAVHAKELDSETFDVLKLLGAKQVGVATTP